MQTIPDTRMKESDFQLLKAKIQAASEPARVKRLFKEEPSEIRYLHKKELEKVRAHWDCIVASLETILTSLEQ
jgi:hypothetical protein